MAKKTTVEVTDKDMIDILEYGKLQQENEDLVTRIHALEEEVRLYRQREDLSGKAAETRKFKLNEEKAMIEQRVQSALGPRGKGRSGILRIIIPNLRKSGAISEDTHDFYMAELDGSGRKDNK